MRRGIWGLTIAVLFTLPVLMGGCGEQVRESRNIEFSADGRRVTFQHGREGLFLADVSTGGLRHIFKPAADVLATSTPLWSPDQTQLLFTTAHRQESEEPAGEEVPQLWDVTPDGQLVSPAAIRYTCWLAAVEGNQLAHEPRAIFTADCGHLGYVAANLAVRWHPDGTKVIFAGQTEDEQHALFEFDLETKRSRRIFPFPAQHVVFDFSPGGNYLACLSRDNDDTRPRNGLWIGHSDGRRWRRVAESVKPTNNAPAIAQLQPLLPVWAGETPRFAFVAMRATEDEQHQHVVFVGDAETRDVRELFSTNEPVRHPRWTPEGQRLAVIVGDNQPALRLLDMKGKLSPPIGERPVWDFVGFSPAGDQLAYVVPAEKSPPVDKDYWATMLIPQSRGRDAIFLAPADGSSAGEPRFSGMRVSFPAWSPTENKLSLWFTFEPSYRSAFSALTIYSLRAGDPAALFDVKTGDIQWLAVNSYELAQVGNYYLLKQNYDEALRWYDRAVANGPVPAARPEWGTLQVLHGSQDFSLFHAYCLQKMGREREAAEKFAEFERTFLPTAPDVPAAATESQRQRIQEARALLDPARPTPRLLRDFYVIEVYLSLDDAAGAERYLRQSLQHTKDEPARLADALALAQLLLLQRQHAEYAEFVTKMVAPLARTQFPFETYDTEVFSDSENQLSNHVTVATLLPLWSRSFVDGLPRETVQQLVPDWETLRQQVNHDTGRLGCDLFLQQAYRRLQDVDRLADVMQRIEQNPQHKELLPDVDFDTLCQMLREELIGMKLELPVEEPPEEPRR